MRIEIQDGPFEGWVINDGLLWTPEGDGYSPGDIRAIQYQREEDVRREIFKQFRQLHNLLRESGYDV